MGRGVFMVEERIKRAEVEGNERNEEEVKEIEGNGARGAKGEQSRWEKK